MPKRIETTKEEPTPYGTDDEKWEAVVAREPLADGLFYYSVKTTGVYCLPSCSARQALRKNVSFHTTPEEAEKEGFRPCKRCCPNGPGLKAVHEAAVANACRIIEASDEAPRLDELAREVGISAYHFHRIFKSTTGVTPKEYAVAHRARRMRDELGKSSTVTEAIYSAGFNSNGRFYAKSTETLGMTPSEFRKGGAGATIRFAVGECSLGSVLVAVSEKGVCAISFNNDPDHLVRDLQDQFPQAELIGGDRKFEQMVAKVVGFIEAPGTELNLPLDVRGTAFQLRVWQALQEIPFGRTASYSEIATKIGMPNAVRAVANACASNQIAVAIPCHRVVRSDGGLSGYRWGVERKAALLKTEEAAR